MSKTTPRRGLTGGPRAAALLKMARVNDAERERMKPWKSDGPLDEPCRVLSKATVDALEAATSLLTLAGFVMGRSQRETWEKQLDALEATVRVEAITLMAMWERIGVIEAAEAGKAVDGE